MTTATRVGGLQSFGVCVLAAAKCVGALQRFVGSVLTTAKRVRGLQDIEECVSANAKRVGALHRFGEWV